MMIIVSDSTETTEVVMITFSFMWCDNSVSTMETSSRMDSTYTRMVCLMCLCIVHDGIVSMMEFPSHMGGVRQRYANKGGLVSYEWHNDGVSMMDF